MVHYFSTVHTTITCPTNYVAFPFDDHVCKVMLHSYPQTNGTMVITSEGARWKQRPTKPRDYHIQLVELDVEEQLQSWGQPDELYSAAGFKLKFSRKTGMYVLVYYLPSTMFVVISWISFFIPPTVYPARVGLLITTLLVLVNTFNNVVANTPRDANNITAIVFWMLGCIFFVFSALFSYAIVITRIRVLDHGIDLLKIVRVKPAKEDKNSPVEENLAKAKTQNFIDMILLCITSFSFLIFIFVYFLSY